MKIKNITKNVAPIAVKAGGAVAASFAIKQIPFGNDKVKAGICGLVGIMLSSQKGAFGQFAEGVAIGSIVKLASAFGIGATENEVVYDYSSVNGTEDGGLLGTEDGGLLGFDED